MPKLVYALVDDLVFASRIGVEVEAAGGSVRRLSSASALAEAVRNDRPSLVIVDLEGMGFDGVAALAALAEVPEADGIPRLAYGSHVDAQRLDAAITAGASDALPRSRFVRELREWIERAE